MTVKAKFRCIRKDQLDVSDGVHFNLEFAAVYDDGKANKDWSKYTPSGSIKMTVTNPAAADGFNVGESYILDFNPA